MKGKTFRQSMDPSEDASSAITETPFAVGHYRGRVRKCEGAKVRNVLTSSVDRPDNVDWSLMDTTQTTIQYDDFARLDLRVATVLDCKPHANADKLLVLQIDLGGEKRQNLRWFAATLPAGAAHRETDRGGGESGPAADARRGEPGDAAGGD